jgi:hypothetical protein
LFWLIKFGNVSFFPIIKHKWKSSQIDFGVLVDEIIVEAKWFGI